MKTYRYLIVGGGMAAAAAIDGIRQVDPQGSIGLVGSDPHPPYKRPPLTKGLWTGKPVESIWLKVDLPEVDAHLGRRVERIEPEARRVLAEGGEAFGYERLLLATGGTPRRLPVDAPGVIYFRTFDDFQALHDDPVPPGRAAVIGGGFIGAELAAALAMNGRQVTMIFPDAAIGARVFPPRLAQFLNEYYRSKGVEVRPGERARGVERRGDQYVLAAEPGGEIHAGQVVAGLGITPNVALAEAAGLALDNGVVVDERLRTSRPEVFAAGDVAAFFNPALGVRLRVEHADNATTMGKVAGQNMAGADTPYDHLPFFYSDLFDLGYEAVGELDPRLELVEDWQEPNKKGVVYYLKDGRVRGVLLWNVWDQVDTARRLIADPGPFGERELKGRIGG